MVLWQVVVFWFHNGVFGNCFVLARQTSDQQPDHRHPYSRFAGLDRSLVVLAHSPVARNPPECAFYDPSARHPASATGACGAFHYFQLPLACCLTSGGQLLPALGTIRPDLCRGGRGTRERESCEQTTGSPGSVRIGRGHVDGNGKTQRIHEDVPFPPLDVLVGIVAADPRRLLNRFHALRIPGFRHLGQDAFLVVRVEGGATLATRASRFHTRRKRRKW